jgi:hypothetical protein
MFEKYVSSIILAVARKYINNVNASDLRLSLWGGAVTLNNVELRVEVLQEELGCGPFTFKRVFIQELKLNIPWASLRYQPAKVRVRNAEVVLWAGDADAVAAAAAVAAAGSTSGRGAAGADSAASAADATPSREDPQELDQTQQGWAESLVSQALANLVADINGLTIRVEMLQAAGEQPTGAVEPGTPHRAMSSSSSPVLAPPLPGLPPPPPHLGLGVGVGCELAAAGHIVPATLAAFGGVAWDDDDDGGGGGGGGGDGSNQTTLRGLAVRADPILADAPLRNADVVRGRVAVVRRAFFLWTPCALHDDGLTGGKLVVSNV